MLTPITADRVSEWLPVRDRRGHKGDYGRVLILAGSSGMMGAAVLCARAALRSGAGLVTVSCAPGFFPVIHCAVPEAMCRDRDLTVGELKRYDAVAIGPGLGEGPDTAKILSLVLENCTGPVVADAGALNAAAAFCIPLAGRGKGVILTPHEGEAARLLRIERAEVRARRQEAALALAELCRGCSVLKGAGTLIADCAGNLYENTTGNPGMATAGAGDVLTGIIAAFAAQMARRGEAPAAAAAAGVYIHGLAGDIAAAGFGQYSLMAGDILAALPEALLRTIGR
jgi:NAD(P)H-hydrate epimerase